MKWLRGVFRPWLERRTHPSQPANWFLEMFRQPTASGVNVTHQTSLQSAAVFACVRILAESVGMLPLIMYERLSDGGKRRAIDHPLYELLHRLPNPEMTSMELRETLVGHQTLWGNAYAEIEFDNGGRVRGLWPLRPDRTTPERVNGCLVYKVTLPTGGQVGLPFERVLHIRGLSYDGVRGYDPISLARQSIGLALATEEFGSRFFGNGSQLGTVLEHPGKLSDEAHERLKKSVEMRHQGLSNAHRLMILEEGMKVESMGVPPENAQFLETRKFQVAEIARLYRIPPHMLADLERATFSNIEQQSLEFVIYTLMPWLTRWEQAIYRDLLTPNERPRYFAEHLVDGLLRGDIKSRYEAYSIGRQNGWLSANDVRTFENLNPIEGGDVYLIPLNMVPANQAGVDDPADNNRTAELPETRAAQLRVERRAREEQIAQGRQRLAGSFRGLFEDAAGRVLRREMADIGRALKKHLSQRDAQDFGEWLQAFYEEHRAFWVRQLLPVLLAYAEQVGLNVAEELGGEATDPDEIRAFIDAYVDKLAARQVATSLGQLQNLLDAALAEGNDPAAAIEDRLDHWAETRTGQIARDESFQAVNAFTWAIYVASGVTRLIWVARGESCPFCKALDGRVIGIRQTFLSKGESFEPEGAEGPLPIRHDIRHAPAHKGCDCIIVAG